MGEVGSCGSDAESAKTELAPSGSADTMPSDEREVSGSADTVASGERAAGDGPGWRAGDRIDQDVLVERVLGRGGMGEVYLVRNDATGRLFAVKTVLPAGLGSEWSRQSFFAELQTWLDLPEHPNLVTCRYLRTVGDRTAIFADFVEGGSLEEWVAAKRLVGASGAAPRVADEGASILDVAIQMARGLAAAHAAGVVHQDVKPSNVLVTARGEAKITDFGLARARPVAPPGGQRGTVTLAGMTPAYCSPEQAGYRRVGPATDAWSWAIAVLQMFVGECPCERTGLEAPAVLRAIRAGSRATAVTLPAEIADVLASCFARDPSDRPALASVAEALVGLHAPLFGRPYARPAPPPPPAREPRAEGDPLRIVGNAPWSDPHEWLALLARVDGGDVPPPRAASGSRRAAAVADLALYDLAQRRIERLVALEWPPAERLLASLCEDVALVRHAAEDVPGRIAATGRAVELWERLVERADPDDAEELRDREVSLAVALGRHANACSAAGDLASALGYRARGIALEERILAAGERKPTQRVELAKSYANYSVDLRANGEAAKALSFAEQAVDLCQGLCDEGHDQRFHLSVALASQAHAAAAMGSNRWALSIAERVIAIRSELHAEEPGDLVADHLAAAHNDAGALLAREKDPASARGHYERAVRIWEALVAAGRREHLTDLATVLGNLGNALGALGDARAQLAMLDRSLGTYEKLVEEEGRSDLADDLARVCVKRGLAAADTGSHGAAVALYDRAIEIWERMAPSAPPTLLPRLASAHAHKSDAALELGAARSAIASAERAIELYGGLVDAGRHDLGSDLADAGFARARGLERAGDAAGCLAAYGWVVARLEALTRAGVAGMEGDTGRALALRAGRSLREGNRAAAVADLTKAKGLLAHGLFRGEERLRPTLKAVDSMLITLGRG